jgi:hypothetical protein
MDKCYVVNLFRRVSLPFTPSKNKKALDESAFYYKSTYKLAVYVYLKSAAVAPQADVEVK